MKKITLVSNSDIVIKIFSLALQDQEYEINVVSNIKSLNSSDMVLLDEQFIDIDLNQVKQYCSNIGFIQKNSSEDEDRCSFIIPKPFLPSTLRDIVKNNLVDIDISIDDFELSNEDNDDESIIDINSLQTHGGSLDKDELYSLKETLKKEHGVEKSINNNIEDDDLLELDKMIDQVICEIEDGTIDIDEDENMIILNKYSVEQLKPLFTIINQGMVDQLSSGKVVDLKIKLKEQ